MISESAYEDLLTHVVLHRPRIDILPNLRELSMFPSEMTHRRLLTTLFLHHTLESLSFSPPCKDGSNIEVIELAIFISDVALRAPNLQTFDWVDKNDYDPPFPEAAAVAEPLAMTLSRLRKLRTVYLPPIVFTKVIWDALSILEDLTDLQILSQRWCHPSGSVPCSRPDAVQEGPFPRLQNLEFELPFWRVLEFELWAGGAGNSRLVRLRITSDVVEISSSRDRLLQLIGTSCKALEELDIRSELEDLSDHQILADDPGITHNTLKPLIDLPLRTLIITDYCRPPNINHTQLDSLLSHWPKLQHLNLTVKDDNFRPTILHSSTPLTLEALPIIARRCPSLSVLALFLDARFDPAALGDSIPSPITERFASLGVLSVGLSPINDAKKTAVYLSEILPAHCSVRHGYASRHDTGDPDWVHLRARETCWEVVKTVVEVVQEATIPLKERIAELEGNREPMDGALSVTGPSEANV